MTIIMNGTINVSRSIIDNSGSINFKNIMVINNTSRVGRMTPQLGASLTLKRLYQIL
jgi:hypothetical protein